MSYLTWILEPNSGPLWEQQVFFSNHWIIFFSPKKVFCFALFCFLTNIYFSMGWGCVEAPQLTWRSEDCFFFPSHFVGPGDQIRSFGLVASTFTHWPISVGQKESLNSHIGHSLVPSCPLTCWFLHVECLPPSFCLLKFSCSSFTAHADAPSLVKEITSIPSAFGVKISDPPSSVG